MPGYLDATSAWESRAGAGPLLRGRRADGPGTLIHFLPGNGFCGGVYWPFLRELLPEHGLFLHDIEGHGASEAPERFSGVGALARRIPQVMADQGLAAPERRKIYNESDSLWKNGPQTGSVASGGGLIGIGHSFGAAMTLKIAADRPELFRALVLLDPIVLPLAAWLVWRGMGKIGRNPMANGARRRRTAWPSRAEALDRLRGRGIFAGWTEESLECFVDHATREVNGARELCCPPELEAQIYEHPVYPWPSFRRVRVPVLFLHGADSYGFLPAAARLARWSNPRVTVRTLPGAHCFMQEHPQAAAAAVREFLVASPRSGT